MNDVEIKEKICQKARDLGAGMVRSCSVKKWSDIPIQEPEFWPENIWPWSRNVIVLAIPLFAPMVQTTPSMVYQELYDTSNRILDEMSYRLANYIVSELGYRAIFFPRDCYYSIEVLTENPNAAFSHVLAGCYAGIGSIGDSHNLISREYGPRMRLVSVITDAPLAEDPMSEEDLCIHCGRCRRECPVQCLKENGDDIYSMDKIACTRHHVGLKNDHHWPCGKCISVCPVGEDMKMYRNVKAVTPEGIVHCQKFGS